MNKNTYKRKVLFEKHNLFNTMWPLQKRFLICCQNDDRMGADRITSMMLSKLKRININYQVYINMIDNHIEKLLKKK